MAYTITITKQHHGLDEGTESEAVEKDGRTMYRFQIAPNRYVTFSWDYIKNHKKYFSVSHSNE